MVKVYDTCNLTTVDLILGDGTKEQYKIKDPSLVIGNLFVGERYVEPQGQSLVTCEQTGDRAEITFKERGFISKKADENSVSAVVKDRNGKECYTVQGKYTERLVATEVATGREWVLFEAPPKPANHEVMYNMNLYSLQLMVASDALRAKLPPTDGRLRGDMKYWDVANLEMATKEKERLEGNQRLRRKKVRELIGEDPNKDSSWDIQDERTFYNPTFFARIVEVDQNGKKHYKYVAKRSADGSKHLYWDMRERNDWTSVPRIYDDDCDAFY